MSEVANPPNELTPALRAYIASMVNTAVAQTTAQMQLYAAVPGREKQRSKTLALAASPRQALLLEYADNSPTLTIFDRIADALEALVDGNTEGLVDVTKAWITDEMDLTIAASLSKTFTTGLFIPRSVVPLITDMSGVVTVQGILDFGNSGNHQKYLAAKQITIVDAENDQQEITKFASDPTAESDLYLAMTTPFTVTGTDSFCRGKLIVKGDWVPA